MSLLKRDNDALHANPDIFHYPANSDINITTHGSDWYWAVTGVMALSTIIFISLAQRKHRSERVFHYITAAITLVASIAYFTMASNLGYAAILVEFQRSNPVVAGTYREIFYVRYIDWVITTPLLLLDLLLTAGLPWPTILYTLLLDEVMIITGLVGALVASSYKFGYFVFGCVALFGVAWQVVYVGLMHAKGIDQRAAQTAGGVGGTGSGMGKVHKAFLICGVWTMFLWFIYPIAWGLCEGGNVISSDSEAVFYGVLDILAKPCFGALLLFFHRNIAPSELGLHIRDYNESHLPRVKNQDNGAALTGNGHNGNNQNGNNPNPPVTGPTGGPITTGIGFNGNNEP